jgi:hypothetical protein
MSLREFETAEGQKGWRYELGRGVVGVLAIRWFPHITLVDSVRGQLVSHKVGHRSRSPLLILGPGECKLVIRAFESERRPDLAVYRMPPPVKDDPWDVWVPAVVVEVVDEETRHTNLVEKAEEYRAFGVEEYWAVDAGRGRVVVHTARSREQTDLGEGTRFRSGAVGGFELDVSRVLGRDSARPPTS